MAGKVIRIERTKSRPGVPETPQVTAKGYKLGDPKFGREKHHGKNAVYVSSLDDAADLISKGYSLWMEQPGKRASLISPGSLQIVRSK